MLVKCMCFALTNTSPRISEGRVLMISGRAEGQWRSERLRRQRSSREAFNAIFKLRSCPLSMHSIYTIQRRRRITEKQREQNGEHSRETTDDKWMSKTYRMEEDD